MSLIPIVLVPQVLFAGVMFQLAGITSRSAGRSRAGRASTRCRRSSRLNDLPSPVPLPYEPEHAHTPTILLVAWATLVVQSLVFSGLAWWKLRK